MWTTQCSAKSARRLWPASERKSWNKDVLKLALHEGGQTQVSLIPHEAQLVGTAREGGSGEKRPSMALKDSLLFAPL